MILLYLSEGHKATIRLDECSFWNLDIVTKTSHYDSKSFHTTNICSYHIILPHSNLAMNHGSGAQSSSDVGVDCGCPTPANHNQWHRWSSPLTVTWALCTGRIFFARWAPPIMCREALAAYILVVLEKMWFDAKRKCNPSASVAISVALVFMHHVNYPRHRTELWDLSFRSLMKLKSYTIMSHVNATLPLFIPGILALHTVCCGVERKSWYRPRMIRFSLSECVSSSSLQQVSTPSSYILQSNEGNVGSHSVAWMRPRLNLSEMCILKSSCQ